MELKEDGDKEEQQSGNENGNEDNQSEDEQEHDILSSSTPGVGVWATCTKPSLQVQDFSSGPVNLLVLLLYAVKDGPRIEV